MGSTPPHNVVPTDAELWSAVRTAPAMLFALDPDGIVTLCEGQALSAVQVRPGDVVGQSIFDLAADIPEVTNGAQRALAGETVTSTVPLAAHALEVRWAPVVSEAGVVTGVTGVAVDVTERAAESRQQAAVAELAQWALRGAPVQDLMNAAVHTVARVLDAPLARLVDVLLARDGVRVMAAFGWPPAAIGAVERHPSHLNFLRDPVSAAQTLMVPDWRTETRYQLAPELRARGVVSSLTVPILAQSHTRRRSFLSVYATAPRIFTAGETAFLRCIGEILGGASPRISAAEAERTVLYGEVLERLERLQEIVSRLLSSQERSRRAISLQTHDKQLTERELQILRLVAEGWSNREIGVELALASGTVKNHVARILAKLDVTDRTQAAVRGLDLGLIQPRP